MIDGPDPVVEDDRQGDDRGEPVMDTSESRRVVYLLRLMADGQVSREEREEAGAGLGRSGFCRDYMDLARRETHALREAFPQRTAPPGLVDEVMAAVEARYDGLASSEAPRAYLPESQRRPVVRPRSGRLWLARLALLGGLMATGGAIWALVAWR